MFDTSLAKATAQALRGKKDIADRGIPVAFVTILKSINLSYAPIMGELWNAIDSQLKGLPSLADSYPRGFLILDGYDQFDNNTQVHIDHELSHLQARGINVMTTGREPKSFEAIDITAVCDSCRKSPLDLYWICRQCWTGNFETCYSLCNSCKVEGTICTVDGNALAFEEMYDYREFHMNLLPEEHFRRFIREEMTKEYGLVINQPSSRIDTTRSSAISEHLMTFMLSDRNITLVKAHMEEVHQMQSWDNTARLYDRIFPSVIRLFDSAIEHIEKQSPTQRVLGLLSIAAAAVRDYGVSFAELESQLQRLVEDIPELATNIPFDQQNVFHSARGFLMVDTSRVSCYVPLFACYARDGYNKTLLWAKAKLEAESDERSQELPVQVLDEAHQTSSPPPMSPPLVSSPPPISPLLASSSPPISPPLGRDNPTNESSIDSGYYSKFSSIMSMKDSDSFFDHRTVAHPQELQPATKQICTICENMIKGKEPERTLTTTLEGFKLSVAERCMFCTTVWEDVKRWSTVDQQRQCKWTVRRKSGFRESEESLVVTYRLTSGVTDEQSPLKQKVFHILPEHEVDKQMSIRLISETTHPAHDSTSQIRNWLHDCRNYHTTCRVSYTPTWVPTRLIDLETGDPDRLRVVNTKDEDICTPYVTLSHCWGNFKEIPFLTLTLSNKSKLMVEGAMLRDLSRNFVDAVAVARHMGVRYIWIDSLCIIQDNGEFSRSEGQLMHKVYRHSYCNISAADSLDSRGGLFRRRDPETIRHAVYEEDGSSNLLTKGRWVVLEDDLWQTQVLGMNIYTRGWVYQGL
ncbi:uncharacterized protein N0V89_007911 [Didymosphaeria variabile]|uniref:Heterokaryon incompatibility domain-containing protein n=1 Tax=Didymosphaeria variabile TaxID=1932322 RepID=A0A9W8XKH1_9PLEO|nr:uncharacterized protein N0V89_007911 [Didymosphaeria variabile]KAJ4352562.1 hypothetical protein N0V89_007911 [Didymosphaeria variabile]